MEHVGIDFARGLKALAFAGMLLGLSFIVLVISIEFSVLFVWSLIIFLAEFTFIFCSIRMYTLSKRSIPSAIIWIGMAYLSLTVLFRVFDLEGGNIMGFFGVPNLIIVVASVFFLKKLSFELSWSRKTLGWWLMGISLASCALWYAIYLYQTSALIYEPAIPYADNCVEYTAHRIVKRRVLTLGSGIAFFAFSLPLYIVARKHSN